MADRTYRVDSDSVPQLVYQAHELLCDQAGSGYAVALRVSPFATDVVLMQIGDWSDFTGYVVDGEDSGFGAWADTIIPRMFPLGDMVFDVFEEPWHPKVQREYASASLFWLTAAVRLRRGMPMEAVIADPVSASAVMGGVLAMPWLADLVKEWLRKLGQLCPGAEPDGECPEHTGGERWAWSHQ